MSLLPAGGFWLGWSPAADQEVEQPLASEQHKAIRTG